MVTIQDIAVRAGVSHSTVSRALSGSPLVNDVTRERVLAIARETGYQVNSVARSLATRTTQSLGLVVPEVKNPYYPALIQHVVDHARSEGYSVLLNVSGGEQEHEAHCLRVLRERRADGVLLVAGASGGIGGPQELAALAAGVPVVILGWPEGEVGLVCDTIGGDDAAGGEALARHLLELGHRRFACLTYAPRSGYAYSGRIDGVRRALTGAGLAPDALTVVSGLRAEAEREAETAAALRVLLTGPDAPTALLAYNDLLAVRVLSALAGLGVSVPGDVSVAGFDNLEIGTFARPHLTSVDYPTVRFASEGVSLLLERLRTEGAGATAPRTGRFRRVPAAGVGGTSAGSTVPPESRRHIVLTPRLVARESTGTPPVRGAVRSS